MLFKVQCLIAITAFLAVIDGSRIIRSPGNRGWDGSFDSHPSAGNARVSQSHGPLARSSWGGSVGAGARTFGNGGYGAARSLGSGWDTGSLGRSSNTGCASGW
ncbi:PREDICTED: uncharacterized protein LOC106106590 [Papilio polytes]|uniref:uncharacterized protein LOC106106590 n=1 Tax=Papilio polytes TaxID=76194 RepID=UPI000675F0F3|nr:PREDICTED: uncharacterized protein LOC106106590 [Papilio polytes]